MLGLWRTPSFNVGFMEPALMLSLWRTASSNVGFMEDTQLNGWVYGGHPALLGLWRIPSSMLGLWRIPSSMLGLWRIPSSNVGFMEDNQLSLHLELWTATTHVKGTLRNAVSAWCTHRT